MNDPSSCNKNSTIIGDEVGVGVNVGVKVGVVVAVGVGH
jgi:hypothetical protein